MTPQEALSHPGMFRCSEYTCTMSRLECLKNYVRGQLDDGRARCLTCKVGEITMSANPQIYKRLSADFKKVDWSTGGISVSRTRFTAYMAHRVWVNLTRPPSAMIEQH